MPVLTDYSMEKLIVFGASTPAGISFTTLQEPGSFFTYTRKIIKDTEENTNININHSDLVELLESSSDSFTFVSFIPIWHLADLMQGLRKEVAPYFYKITRLLACSSTSASTKRFSFSRLDQQLSADLRNSEDFLHSLSTEFDITLTIVRPTMIFGSPIQHPKGDRNISLVSRLLKFTPILFLPSELGTRQPIHFTQLAQVFASLNVHDNDRTSTIEVGGDEVITLYDMIHQLTPYSKPFIITLNTKLFIFLFSGISLLSDKTHAAFLRIFTDLSGFTPASSITQTPIRTFSSFLPSQPST